MSNELISKIIWRTNFLFGFLFCFLYFLWIVGIILKYTLVSKIGYGSKTWKKFMKQFWRWIQFGGVLLSTWLSIESDEFFFLTMCYYTKVYFNIIPTIHKKYRKQNKSFQRNRLVSLLVDLYAWNDRGKK
jgi:energy-coupling factor transporter transmembrane protein EcfT